MTSVQYDFKTRAAEVENYFQFVLGFAEGEILLTKETGDPAVSSEGQEGLLKTLKATGFLLLYNLVESTMKNAIEAIFDELKSAGISFDDCREELQKVVLRNLKKRAPGTIYAQLSPIATQLVTQTFDKEELFNGNVDARLIRDIADEYGISRRWKTNGEKLLYVKHNRNQLAHGNKSFSEVGKDYTTKDLNDIKTEVLHFLSEVLNSVANYISEKHFLNTSALQNQKSFS